MDWQTLSYVECDTELDFSANLTLSVECDTGKGRVMGSYGEGGGVCCCQVNLGMEISYFVVTTPSFANSLKIGISAIKI